MTENQIIQDIYNIFKMDENHMGFGRFGDDAVSIPAPSSQDHIVISTDTFNEGTHFDANVNLYSVGHKSFVAAASDIVAMGAGPSFFMLNLSLPESLCSQDGVVSGRSDLKKLLSSIYKASSYYGVKLLGGDVTKGKDLSITYTVAGYQSISKMKQNFGKAQKGDVICVDSPLNLGHALLGYHQNVKNISDTSFINEFLMPKINIELGLWLSSKNCVSSLTDISDGLLKEVKNLSSKSKLKIKLSKPDLDSLFIRSCKDLELDPEEIYFKGGEEYSLMWTLPKVDVDVFFKVYEEKFKRRPVVVGELLETCTVSLGSSKPGKSTPGYTNVIYELNQPLIDSIKPFEHFSST